MPLTDMGDVEQRMGLLAVETLLSERDALVKQAAMLAARHGSALWDAERKAFVSRIVEKLRGEAALKERKVTEAGLETAAYGSLDYADYLAQALTEKAEWFMLQNRIEGITATLNRGQVVARYLSAELHLTP